MVGGTPTLLYQSGAGPPHFPKTLRVGNTLNSQEQQQILRQVRNKAEELLTASPRCHDLDHTLRVVDNARHLREIEGGDCFIIECAAFLHDIGRGAEFADRGQSCHAAIGAEQVPSLLAQAGLRDKGLIDRIAGCVGTHRYRNPDQNNKPLDIEAKIVFDADKLDSMGAIGIGRAFHFAGRIGARVHNREEEAIQGKSYTSEDTAFREYLVKLRHLQERLLTEEGRRIGQSRYEFMRIFFNQLQNEVKIYL